MERTIALNTPSTLAIALILVFATTSPLVASGQDCGLRIWTEDFETYLPGEYIIMDRPPIAGSFPSAPAHCFPMCPPGLSWQAWDDLLGNGDSEASDLHALSPPMSGRIIGTQDPATTDNLVHTLHDLNLTTGVWKLETAVYIPDDFVGETLFVLLNQYESGGAKNWSTQVRIGAEITSDFDGVSLPRVTGKWSNIRVQIDFDNDRQDVFYNDQCLVSKSWSQGVSGGGTTRLQALDLFAGLGSSPVYYDEMVLCRPTTTRSCVCPGDLDGNRSIDLGDLLAILVAWGNVGGPEDLDESGTVDFGDILVVLGSWGPCPL